MVEERWSVVEERWSVVEKRRAGLGAWAGFIWEDGRGRRRQAEAVTLTGGE